MTQSGPGAASDPVKLLDQLRQSLGLLQVAFDASNQIMLILDANHRVRWGNQPAADQWTNSLGILLPGKHFCELVSLFDQNGSPLSENQSEHPLQQSRSNDGSNRFLIKTDDSSEEKMSAYRIRWRRVTEVPGGFLLITFSDLNPSEQALTRQQRFLNQFAHELRTPLAIISGCFQRLQRMNGASKNKKSQVQIGQEEVQRISNLLDKLSVLTEIDSGSYRIRPETADLLNFLQSWTRTLPATTRNAISFNLDAIRRRNTKLSLDQIALGRILNEVVDNSLRFSPPGAPIVIEAAVQEKSIAISIRDSGPAIPDEDLERVFERFTRIEQYRGPDNNDGAGLGLAVAKELTMLMNGSIQLRPNRDINGITTQGCRIEIIFPLALDFQDGETLDDSEPEPIAKPSRSDLECRGNSTSPVIAENPSPDQS